MKQKHINIPIGVLDTDSDLIAVSPEDYTYSTGLRQYPGEKVRRSIKGNELKSYTQPAGDNVTIGTAEDNYRKTLIDFVKNRARNHHIRRFFEDGRYETLIQGSILNFDSLINEAVVIDGKHLFWTDATGENPSGNPPRYIDMDYISLYQKNLCYELYWDGDSFQAGYEYSIRIEDLDGNIVLANTLFRTSTGGATDAEVLVFYNALVAGAFDITTEFCGNKIKICAATAEQRVYITSTGADIHFVSTNHYPETITDQYISLIRMMPRVAPQPRFVNDATVNGSNVFGFTFQFRYRYIYWNRAKSRWSPISYVPTNFTRADPASKTVNSEDYNKIEIDFIDDIFASAGWKSFVRKVEVAVRYEFSGVWRSVGVYDVADFGVASSVGFEFLNDGSYPVIPSDENSEGGVQALGNFDFVPRFTRAMEVIQDENGDHRLSLSGNIEQFDAVDCIDALVAVGTGFVTAPPATATDQVSTNKTFKSGGAYPVYVIDEDEYGRQWPGVKIGTYRPENPEWSAGVNFPEITINHLPPIDSKRFRIAFGENENQGEYLQEPCYNVGYFYKATDADGDLLATTYAAGDADVVGFIFQYPDLPGEAVNFFFRDADAETRQVIPGDRLHVMDTADDFPVIGYTIKPFEFGIGTTYTVYIDFTAGMTDHQPVGGGYVLIELYRPSTSDSGIIYEVSDPITITDPGLPTRSYGPQIDLTDIGDTYIHNYIHENGDLIRNVESKQMYLFKRIIGNDFGRASTTDPDFSERNSYDQVRVSDIFIPDSSANGLHSFRGLEYVRTRRDYGSIQSLQYIGGVLLAIGQFGTQPIYVGKTHLMDLSGGTQVGRTSKLLNIGPELSARLGTHNPESIINTGKYVYGWDGYNGVPWRYSVGGGIDEINYKNINKFRELGRSSFPTRQVVLGGYEPDFETYYLTFKDPLFPQTLGFAEKTPGNTRMGWEGNFPFIPEYYGRVGQRMFSFRNGLAYEHEIGDTLYGITYVCDLTVVVNSSPKSVKIFWNTEIQGDKWWIPVISVPPGTSVNGMSSRVVAGKLQKYEGVWKVDLPRDGNDPLINPPPSNPILFINSLLRGRRLRGDAMEMTFRLVDSQGVIKRIETEFSFSEETKK